LLFNFKNFHRKSNFFQVILKQLFKEYQPGYEINKKDHVIY
jgi:hypothetical protein